MDDKFQRLENKLDTLSDKLVDIDKTLVRNTVSLEDHVRRTNLLEEKLAPVERHVAMIQGIVKFIALMGVLLGIAKAVL
jgi:hypothetical protein